MYFIAGMFVAAAVFGMITYGIHRWLARRLAQTATGPGTISIVGYALFVAECVVIFFVARWVVNGMLFP